MWIWRCLEVFLPHWLFHSQWREALGVWGGRAEPCCALPIPLHRHFQASAAKQPSRPDQEHLEVGKDRAHPSERFDVPSFNWKEDMWE